MSKNKDWFVRYLMLLLGCYFLGLQIRRVFFKDDYVAVSWFDYVGVYGITFLIMLFLFIYWDKYLSYFEPKKDE